MEVWQNDDYEKPIEEYPGYLGLTWDGTFMAGEDLRPLKGFDLQRYSELVDQHGAAALRTHAANGLNQHRG